MRISDEKISHLSHVLLRGLLEKNAISPLAEHGEIRREIKRIVVKELKIAEDMDATIKSKLQSYSKKIPEGSAEWEVLYHKFFLEEAGKKGRT